MSSFLSTLDPTERAELEAVFQRRRYADGTPLFEQGDDARGGYLVRSGAISLEMTIPGGAPLVVGRVEPGAFLGEPALLEESTRSLTARAVGEVEVDALDRQDFLGLRHGLRPASFRVMLQIARTTAIRLQYQDRAIEGRDQRVPDAGDDMAAPLGSRETPGLGFDPLPFLPKFPFFEDFGDTDLRDLIAMGTLWELPRGRVLLRTGQTSDTCYAVIRGAVEATHDGQRVALFGPGRVFGELAPLLGTRVVADCAVREDAALLQLGPDALSELLEPRRRLSYRFVTALCMQLLTNLRSADRALARSEQQRRLRALSPG